VVGYVAVFLAITGVTWAAQTAPKNTVVSKSIKNGQVKGKDLAAGAVTAATVAPDSIGGGQIVESTLAGVDADKLDGLDSAELQNRLIDSFPVSLPPDGSAGGDLSGTYPNPSIGNGKMTTAKFASLPAATLKDATYDHSGTACVDNGAFPQNFGNSFTFRSEVFDNANLFSQNAGGCTDAVFTAPIAGTYVLTGSITWAFNSTGQRKIDFEYLNPPATGAASQIDPEATGNETIQSISQVIHLTAGQRALLGGSHTATVPVNVNDGTFGVAWVGP
jgi:hypothetical protein